MEKVMALTLLAVCIVSCAARDVNRVYLEERKWEAEQPLVHDVRLMSVMKMHQEILEVEKEEYQEYLADLPNIPGLVKQLGLNTLLELVVKAKLDTVLSSPGPFTVFGPTNEAFKNLPEWAKALVANETILAEVLKYHVLSGKVMSSSIKDELLVPTVQGKKLRFNIYGDKVVTAQCSPIDLNKLDQEASNGVVHVLDRVMFVPYGNIVETVASCPAFKTLVTAVKAAGLVDALSGDGPFTLFAPTDAAFKKLPPGTLDNLLKNQTALQNVLKYHVTEKTYCSAGLTSTSVTTLNGQKINIKVSAGSVEVNNAKVISADGSVTNGVVHAIDTVLLPSDL